MDDLRSTSSAHRSMNFRVLAWFAGATVQEISLSTMSGVSHGLSGLTEQACDMDDRAKQMPLLPSAAMTRIKNEDIRRLRSQIENDTGLYWPCER